MHVSGEWSKPSEKEATILHCVVDAKLSLRCGTHDGPCIAPPVSPLLPVPNAAARVHAPANGDLLVPCAYCKQKIYGVRYSIGDRNDEVLHFGCCGLQQRRRSDEAFQIALGQEMRSLKGHLRNERRRLHEERWRADRMQPKRRIAQPATVLAISCPAQKEISDVVSMKNDGELTGCSRREESHNNVKLEHRVPPTPSPMKQDSTRTSKTLLGQLLSRAFTVAVYMLGLEWSKMLALPTWMCVVSAYSVAAVVPILLPSAHGDRCRVTTAMAASTLAATRVSVASAIILSIVLCLCPASALWWPSDETADKVTLLLKEILRWLDEHDDVLPARNTRAKPAGKEEDALRNRYGKRPSDLTNEQRALQQEIERRKTDPADLQTVEEVARWSARNNGSLPIQSRDDKEQNHLAQKLRRLRTRDSKSPKLQKRLDELNATVHRPTPKRRRLVGKQVAPQVWRAVQSSSLPTPPPKRMKLWNKDRAGSKQDKRDRAGRKQDRAGRKQDKRDRAGRKQDRAGRKRDRSERLHEDLRRMRSRPVASDNQDGTRQDLQANLYNPVCESHIEEEMRSAACEQRIRYGDLFLLLHLLDPWIKLDDAIRKFQDFYVYAGCDCTNIWANFSSAASCQLSIVLHADDVADFFLRWTSHCTNSCGLCDSSLRLHSVSSPSFFMETTSLISQMAFQRTHLLAQGNLKCLIAATTLL